MVATKLLEFENNKIFERDVFIFIWIIAIMGKRVTIVLDEEIYEKLRKLQAKMIQDSNKSVSFSRVINENLFKTTKKK